MPATRALATVSLPPALLREAKHLADKEGRTTSEVFRESLRQYLWFNRWERIRKYGMTKVSTLGARPEDIDLIVHAFRRKKKARGRR